MPKPATIAPATDFAHWLIDTMNERGWERKTLSINSGVGQSSISQIIGGLRAPSRDMVERLARALSTDDADDRTARALLNVGLKAAGFTAGDEQDYLDTVVMEAGYEADDLDDAQREELRIALDRAVIGVMEQQKRARRKG